MNWTPPETLKEKVKRYFVPPQIYIKYLYNKERRNGEKEIRLVPFLARNDRVSLDIGACKGVYSYALLQHSSRVYAFEPNPKLFNILKHWSNELVVLHEVALSNETGAANLLIPKGKVGYSNQGGSLSRVKVSGRHNVVKVKAMRLDDLDIENVGFMKIDVEGFEAQVLEGAEKTLHRDRPNLLIEIEERHTKRPLPEMVDRVCAYGYDCFFLARGALTPFRLIDLERQHRKPAAREDYVFNFIFLPASIQARC